MNYPTAKNLQTIVLFAVLGLYSAFVVNAAPYGTYEPSKIVKKNESGTGGSLDLGYADTMLQDLRTHAENYPTQFDAEADKARARRDVAMLMGMLSIVGKEPNAPFEICLRLGMLAQIGYNLQLPGMDEAAQFYFSKALRQQPTHAVANFQFGLYFAQSNRAAQAINHLEIAKSAGYAPALFTLGLVHLSLKDAAKALDHLSAYREKAPSDTNAVTIIDAIKQGNLKIESSAN